MQNHISRSLQLPRTENTAEYHRRLISYIETNALVCRSEAAGIPIHEYCKTKFCWMFYHPLVYNGVNITQ